MAAESHTNPIRLGGIEAGGTKFVCAIGTSSGDILHQAIIPTTTPPETMTRVIEFFQSADVPIVAMGVGSFGPLQLDRRSPQFGFITSTPKSAWRYFDIVGTLRKALDVPVAFDTDVNAAALAEATWGAASGLRTFLFITVGTGVGGGAMIDGSLLHGSVHPEMGHIRVPHDLARDSFPGSCPYHGDCLEGLASGGAVEARWGASPTALAADHPAWALEAEYLALACTNWTFTLSPERIVFGGGLMQPHIFPLLRKRAFALMNRYLEPPEFAGEMASYIVPSSLAGRAGVLGALALAAREVGVKEGI